MSFIRKTNVNYRFVVWQSHNDNKWYFHWVSPNNKVMFPSEGYETKAGVRKAIRTIRRQMWLSNVVFK